jgi:hypothetical protein
MINCCDFETTGLNPMESAIAYEDRLAPSKIAKGSVKAGAVIPPRGPVHAETDR